MNTQTKAPITADEALKKCMKLEKQVLEAIKEAVGKSKTVTALGLKHIYVGVTGDASIDNSGVQSYIVSVALDPKDNILVDLNNGSPVKVDRGIQSTADLITILKAVE